MQTIHPNHFQIADGELMESKKYIQPAYSKLSEIPIRIGVVGNSASDFDEGAASMFLFIGLHKIKTDYETRLQQEIRVSIVSGLTDIGIPGMSYRIAKSVFDDNLVSTVGIACSKAKYYPQYQVTEKHIVGDNWGDESHFFVDSIDCLVRVGGGDQSKKEVDMFKQKYPEKLVLEYNI